MKGEAKSSRVRILRGPVALAVGGLLSLGALAVAISMGIVPLVPGLLGDAMGLVLFPAFVVLAPLGFFFIGLGLLYILKDAFAND